MPTALADATRRAATYKALAECYHPPDEALMALLAGAAELTPGPVGDMAECAGRSSDLEALRVDHAKLFVGPFKLLAAPYGSLYLEGETIMGESSLDVSRRYAEEGLDVILKDAPDHVAMELEFMGVLILRQAAAIESADEDTAPTYREKQLDFLTTHLGRWTPEFTAAVEAGAATEFYKTLGRVTREFLHGDLQYLSASGEEAGETQECQDGQCCP